MAVLFVVGSAIVGLHGVGDLAFDFTAFYCAGRTLRDPYALEPLRRCEQHVFGNAAAHAVFVLPAPLPGYALAAFAPLSRLDYPLALDLWLALLAIAYAASVVALMRLSGLTLVRVVAATAAAAGFLSIALGQIVVVAIAGTVLAALALRADRPRLAALLACGAMLEPHLGLPVLCSLAWWERRCRLPVALGLAGLALVSYAALGLAANLAYLRVVLPAHARSEIASEQQYSVTHVVHLLGASDGLALMLGTAAFVAALVGGVRLARALVPTLGVAALVVVPPALVLVASSFLHIANVAFALPLALLVYARRPSLAIGLAIFALAIPWGAFAQLADAALFVAIVATLAARSYVTTRLPFVLGIAAAAVLAVLWFHHAVAANHAPLPRHLLVRAQSGNAAEDVWTAVVEAFYRRDTIVYELAKIPTFAGLAALAYATWRLARENA